MFVNFEAKEEPISYLEIISRIIFYFSIKLTKYKNTKKKQQFANDNNQKTIPISPEAYHLDLGVMLLISLNNLYKLVTENAIFKTIRSKKPLTLQCTH